MKITLEFKDEDAEEALTALDGYKWKLALWDLDQYLRSKIKYNPDLTEEAYEALENCKYKITILLQEYNLRLD
jgi:hypothetical protein